MYSSISKETLPLYFGLDVFCQFEAKVPEFDTVFSVHCSPYTSTATVLAWGEGSRAKKIKILGLYTSSSPNLQRRDLFADLRIHHLCFKISQT